MVKILKTFYSGLIASTAVINNGDIPAYRIDKSGKNEHLNCFWKFLYLPKFILRDIIFKRVRIIEPSFSEVLYAGHTENNIREFEFFYSLCIQQLDHQDKVSAHNNICNFPHKGFFSLKKKKHLTYKFIFSCVVFLHYLFGSTKLNATSYKYIVDYTCNFLQYYLNYRGMVDLKPAIIVLANDHNPKYIAISKVFKALGTKRVYLQHGGVSPLFPKLEFDFSVLFDRKTIETYVSIGPLGGEVVTISRIQKAPSLQAYQSYGDSDKVDICIIPTSIVDIDNLNDAVSNLIDNPHVNKVFIKPHPRFSQNQLLDKRAKTISNLDEFRSKRVIYIAGNTTMAMELAVRGEEVYQQFDIDPIGTDYYGYVEDGIVNSVSTEDIKDRFWENYYEPPIARLSKYSPHIDGKQEQSISRLTSYVQEVLSQTSRSNESLLNKKSKILLEKFKEEFELLHYFETNHPDKKLLDYLLDDNAITFDEARIVREYCQREKRVR